MSAAEVSDDAIRAGVAALFEGAAQRTLQRVLAEHAPQCSRPLRDSFPAALLVALTARSSAGEGNPSYEALAKHQGGILVNTNDPQRVQTLASAVVQSMPDADKPHCDVVQSLAAANREKPQQPKGRRPAAGHFSVPNLAGHA